MATSQICYYKVKTFELAINNKALIKLQKKNELGEQLMQLFQPLHAEQHHRVHLSGQPQPPGHRVGKVHITDSGR